MKALQTWMPPRWLHPALAFMLMVGLMVVTGITYLSLLAIVWLVIGLVAVVISFVCGDWNYNDTFGQRACLGALHLLLPPIWISLWIADLQEDRRNGVSSTVVDVPTTNIVGAIFTSLFGLVMFAAFITSLSYLMFVQG